MTRMAFERRAHAGFTLVELLVGMLIGLIGIMVIFQAFSVTESTKRTTTGGGDAQQNGSIGLFSIEREVRMAGFGVFAANCMVRFYDEGVSPPRETTLRLVPIEILQPENQVPPGVAGGPDQIVMTFGSSDVVLATKLTQSMPSPSADYKVEDRYGFYEGDFIIAVQPGRDCSAAQVSNIPGTPGQTDNVIHASGTYTDENGSQQATRYNKPAGLGVRYDTGALLYNLGKAPTRTIYSVVSSRLNRQNEFTEALPVPVLDNIVQLQAHYGIDRNNNGIVEAGEWTELSPPNGDADWVRIMAVRVALVARSSTPEKRDPTTGLCSATTANPKWPDDATEIDLAVTVAPGNPADDWQCYRYKLFSTVVPLRKKIWSQEL